MRTLLLFIFASTLCTGQIINTIAGTGTLGYSGNGGSALSAQLYGAVHAVPDTAGNYYIVEWSNHIIRKVNAAGIIDVFAGTSVAGYSGDGGPANLAQLTYPMGLAIDDTGNVYIADGNNSVVRKVNVAGIISTAVGTGTYGYSGDGGLAIAAQIGVPAGLSFDAKGNLYIVDMVNNAVRKVRPDGIISTLATNLLYPTGIAVDTKYNVYVCNTAGQQIIKYDTLGNNTVYAGTGAWGYSGDNGPAVSAQLNLPSYTAIEPPINIGVDKLGQVYIPDWLNHRVRMIDTMGIIRTIAGTGVGGFSGDGGLATLAKISGPTGVSVDNQGSIFIADYSNYRIRKIQMPNSINDNLGSNNFYIYPMPVNDLLTIHATFNGKACVFELFDLLGHRIEMINLTGPTEISISHIQDGIYLAKFTQGGVISTKKVIIQH